MTTRKLIITLAACFIAVVSFGQDSKVQNDEIQSKANARVTLLQQQLDLTEEQVPQVRELVTSIEYKKASNSEKPETLEMILDEQLSQVLTEEQHSKYRQMQSEQKKNDTN